MLNVLCVDDEPSMLRLISIFFEEDKEIKIICTSSAAKALEIIRTENFDVLVSDYQMPEIDGIAFLKTLRERGNPIPFILLTGQVSEGVVIEAISQGADLFLQKCMDFGVQFVGLKKAIIQMSKKRVFENRPLNAVAVTGLL
jgi:CheY-like chemotaxis protein